jgi:hypothetical protein
MLPLPSMMLFLLKQLLVVRYVAAISKSLPLSQSVGSTDTLSSTPGHVLV